MIRLEIFLEIGHGGVMRVCAIEGKIALVVVVASYRSVSRNPVLVPRATCDPVRDGQGLTK